MMNAIRIFAVAALFCSTASTAAEQVQSPISELFHDDGNQWLKIDSNMSPEEYQNSGRQNQRMMRKSAKKLLLQASKSVGIPKQGVALTGAAVGLVLEGAKFNLNESKTMALQLNEVASQERAISLRIRFHW